MTEEKNSNEPQNPAFLVGAVISSCGLLNKEVKLITNKNILKI